MKNFIKIFLLSLLISCGDNIPNDVLPKEKMEAVLWDVVRGGEYVNGYIYLKDPFANRAAVNNKLLDEILRIHKVSRKEFDKSFEFYQDNPHYLARIMDSVFAQRTRYNENQKAELARRDSLIKKLDSAQQKRNSLSKGDSLKKNIVPIDTAKAKFDSLIKKKSIQEKKKTKKKKKKRNRNTTTVQ